MIHSFLRDALNELQELADRNTLPKSWANATKGHAVVACQSELRWRFWEFALCSVDWKARTFMIEWYPSWAWNHLVDNNIKVVDTVPAKCTAASQSSKQPNKKIKVKEEKLNVPQIRDPLCASKMLLYA